MSAASIVREAGGDELVERLEHLDAMRGARAAPRPAIDAPDRAAHVDVDVAFAGGGLGVLLAPMLAARGLTVAVFERARAASTHREWNASRSELTALSRAGLFTPEAVDALVVARYREGVCVFHRGGRHAVRGVLDHAVDAGELLAQTRAKAEALGVRFHDRATVVGERAGEASVRLRVRDGRGEHDVTARVLVDARGASSPYATADLVCPTVGGVLAGLAEGGAPDEIDPAVGEILATNDDAEEGRQHVWEAFPGRPGEATIYLFYYADADAAGSLASLYARFFERLPSYKRGAARLVRPTFGFIPGWSRLTPAPRSPSPRVVLVGDAAARHSPLTYCGFGAMLRSLGPAASAVVWAADGDASRACAAQDAPVHAMTGALAKLMASRRMRGGAMNDLLDAAFGALAGMGEEAFASLLQDTMPAPQMVDFLRRTASTRRSVYLDVLRGLGPVALGRWGARVAREVVRAR